MASSFFDGPGKTSVSKTKSQEILERLERKQERHATTSPVRRTRADTVSDMDFSKDAPFSFRTLPTPYDRLAGVSPEIKKGSKRLGGGPFVAFPPKARLEKGQPHLKTASDYPSMTGVLDKWADDETKRADLAQEMIDFSRTTGKPVQTSLSLDSDTAQSAALFSAVISAAESRPERANPDGGSLGRATLELAKKKGFGPAFTDEDTPFQQALPGGNAKTRRSFKKVRKGESDIFHDIDLSESSQAEDETDESDDDRSPILRRDRTRSPSRGRKRKRGYTRSSSRGRKRKRGYTRSPSRSRTRSPSPGTLRDRRRMRGRGSDPMSDFHSGSPRGSGTGFKSLKDRGISYDDSDDT